jgi:hypothetical protein
MLELVVRAADPEQVLSSDSVWVPLEPPTVRLLATGGAPWR